MMHVHITFAAMVELPLNSEPSSLPSPSPRAIEYGTAPLCWGVTHTPFQLVSLKHQISKAAHVQVALLEAEPVCM
jgi:hypothetical protein